MGTAIGVGFLLFGKGPYYTGVGLSAILLTLTGHVEETISMRFNERYYRQVIEEAQCISLNIS
jgi:hypothetical protein